MTLEPTSRWTLIGDDGALDAVDTVVLADGAEADVGASVGDAPGGDVAVGAADGVDELAGGDAALGEVDGVEADLDLAFAAAEDVDLGDAGHALDGGLDAVLGEVLHGADVKGVGRGGAEDDPGDVVAVHPVRGEDDGLVGVFWVVGDLAELVGDFAEGFFLRCAGEELQADRAAGLGAGAGHLLEALEALQLLFLLVDDLLLDLVGAGALPEGLDGDDGVLDVGRELDGDALDAEDAGEHDEDHADGHGDRLSDDELEEVHEPAPSSAAVAASVEVLPTGTTGAVG